MALACAAGAAALASDRAARVAPAEIVFSSDRASANPGEVYSLAPGTAPRDVTRSPAAELALAVSPIGRRIAFWSDRSGRWQLYLAGADGSGARPVPGLATQGYPGQAPAFSPDGSQLLVPRAPAAGGGRTELAVVSVATRRLRVLGTGCNDFGFSWSPDATLVSCVAVAVRRVFVLDAASGRPRFSHPGTRALWSPAGLLAVADGSSTAILDASGAPQRTLAGAPLAWSPDGRLLALARPGAVAVVDAKAGTAVRTARGPAPWTAYWGAFTPDGADLAYTAAAGTWAVALASGAVRAVPAAGGAWSRDGRYAYVRYLSDDRVAVEVGDRLGAHARSAGSFPFDDHGTSALAWLPDGSRVLYSTGIRPRSDLWAVQSDGSGLRRLTASGLNLTEPAWSHDGTRLAYAAAPYSGGLCGYCDPRVVIADAAGRRLALVPGTPGGDSPFGSPLDAGPSWSPDGTRLALEHELSGELDVVTLAQGTRVRIAADGFSPAWSPDGSTIAYVGGGQIRAVAPDGTGTRTLAPAVRDAESVAWSPDGRTLAYSTETGIYVVPADASAPPRRVAAARQPGRPSFSPDGALLAFAAGTGSPLLGRRNLFLVRLDGGGLHAVAPSPFDDEAPTFRPSA
jgi:Tol biopolymer transport system component